MLFADEDKIITNGIDYGTTISLADGVNSLSYYEISMKEYEKLFEVE